MKTTRNVPFYMVHSFDLFIITNKNNKKGVFHFIWFTLFNFINYYNMIQASDNILVVNAGEVIPEGNEDALKIYLAGSTDMTPGSQFNWRDKFIDGLVSLSSNTNNGLIMLKNQRFVIVNPVYTANNPEPTILNPEFVTKINWTQDMFQQCDAVFCNFLKRSTAMMPMFEFGCLATSQKMIVRCPEEYCNYSLVKIICERNNIPLYPGKVGTIPVIIQAMYSYIPKFSEINKLQLPE